MMISQTIDHSETPLRLFKSDFLEFFTHIHPAVVLIIWVPVVLYGLIRGIFDWPAANKTIGILITFLIGLFIWTLAEYLLHRFLFHYHAKTPAMERVFFLFHGVHHAQ
ncbi:MAG: sterol desaturase family protein, partial [Bellilinea sp.]